MNWVNAIPKIGATTASSTDETAPSPTSLSGRTCIRASGVGKTYDTDDIVALSDIDLEVYDQEFLCLLGPSGCGKSTFLRILAGLIEEHEGVVEIDRTASAGGPTTSMVFQEHGIFPWKTVIDNVAFGLKMQGVDRSVRYETAKCYLEKVDLTEFADSYPHQLSGGMKQRVGLARAFANDPDILLMDEPFGVLDAQTKAYLQEELLSLWSESRKTVVFVTHDIEEAITLGDRLGVLTARPGEIKELVDVDLPRPRTRADRRDSRFVELYEQVWGLLADEVEKTATGGVEHGR